MSLTSYIHKSGNPVREFFEQWFPNTRPSNLLVANVDGGDSSLSPVLKSSSLRRPWDSGPLLVDPGDLTPSERASIGTAFDYRVRFTFEGVHGIQDWVAVKGARELTKLFPFGPKIPEALRQLLTELEGLLDPTTDLRRLRSETEEKRLDRLCYVLALYEQCARGNLNVKWPIAAKGTEASLQTLTRMCRPEIAEDLASLSRVFLQSASLPFWDRKPILLNPRFEASGSLGADADIIVGETLLDLKTTDKARPDRQTIWQLLGYVLSDTHDEYSIRRVGFYYARYGTTLIWELDALIELLAGRPILIEDARDAFAVAVQSIAESNRLVRESEMSNLETTFERSIAAEPHRAIHYGAFAAFLEQERGDLDRTEAMFERAIAVDPNIAGLLRNYANFLRLKRKDFSRARLMFERAVAAEANEVIHANCLGHFAMFLYIDEQNLDQAEAMFEQAIDCAPNEPGNLGNFAEFLAFARNDVTRAEVLFGRALASDPNHIKNLANYSRLLFEGGHVERAKVVAHTLLNEAALRGGSASRKPTLMVSYYVYALLPEQRARSLETIRSLLEDGVRCRRWDYSVILMRSKPSERQSLELLARVIHGDDTPTTLDALPEWRAEHLSQT